MAGAVLRPSGSLRICSGGTSGRSRRTALAPAPPVVHTQTDSGPIDRRQPLQGVAQERPLPFQGQELLGPRLARQGPEARAAAAGQDQRPHARPPFRHLSIIFFMAAEYTRPLAGRACPGFPFRRHYGKDHILFVASLIEPFHSGEY